MECEGHGDGVGEGDGDGVGHGEGLGLGSSAWTAISSWAGGEVTVRSGAVPVACAVLRTVPASASASVTVYEPVQVVTDPGALRGASAVDSHCTPVSRSSSTARSVTVRSVVLVTVYV